MCSARSRNLIKILIFQNRHQPVRIITLKRKSGFFKVNEIIIILLFHFFVVIEPSKPDVFFIKYKTKQEAEQAQQQIQGKID